MPEQEDSQNLPWEVFRSKNGYLLCLYTKLLDLTQGPENGRKQRNNSININKLYDSYAHER